MSAIEQYPPREAIEFTQADAELLFDPIHAADAVEAMLADYARAFTIVPEDGTANTNAVAGELYEYSLTSTGRTINAIASPANGDEFGFVIVGNTGAVGLTVAPRSGQTLEVNDGTNFVARVIGAGWIFRWDDTNDVWRIRPLTLAGTSRVRTLADTGTPAPDLSFDGCRITTWGAATGLAAPVGTPLPGKRYWVSIKAPGATRAIDMTDPVWRAAQGVTLPTTIVGGGAITYIEYVWNELDSKCDVIRVTSTSGGTGSLANIVEDTTPELGGDLDALTHKIVNLGTPSASTDAATKGYVDAAVVGLWDKKGATDCSANPNYPAAVVGDAYIVSVAGKIGGASGVSVAAGDWYVAITDNAGGTQASVGTSWSVLEHNRPEILSLAEGGTGAATATAGFDALSGVSSTAWGRALNALADAAALRTYAGLVIGTNVQAWDTDLDTWATKTPPSGTPVGTTDTQTLTAKRITKRVVAMTNATSVTPTGDTADVNTLASTQAAGTLTIAAPSGTPTDGQPLVLRMKSTNAQTYAWNAIFRAGTDFALPTTLAATKTDYVGFIYNGADSKWDCVAASQGF